jgi:tryptophanase
MNYQKKEDEDLRSDFINKIAKEKLSYYFACTAQLKYQTLSKCCEDLSLVIKAMFCFEMSSTSLKPSFGKFFLTLITLDLTSVFINLTIAGGT